MKQLATYILLLMSLNVLSQKPTPAVLAAFEAHTFDHEGKALPYRILYPKNFDLSNKYPVHLFLHGAGERGDDNEAQLAHGSKQFLENQSTYPAIVIFPQCPKEDYWADVQVQRTQSQNTFTFPKSPQPTWAMRAVQALLDQTLSKEYVDKNRIYLSGLSMGGMGTFELLSTRPDTFAAATPICGGGYPANVAKWAQKTPVWIFHGKEDQVVPILYSRLMLETLVQQQAAPRVSFYDNTNHDSWTKAFAEPDFLSWIYGQSKQEIIPTIPASDECTPEWLKFSEATLLGKYKSQNDILKKKADPDRIVFMGDSITEGWVESTPEFWEAHPHYVNRGTSGHTTPQMLIRFRQDVLDLKPQLVVLLAGTNDIAGNTGKTSPETIVNNIKTMAELAKSHQIAVAISSILPVQDYPWEPGLEPASTIYSINEELQAYAVAQGFIFIDYHSAMKNNQGGMRSSLTYDGVHCTKAGYQIMQRVLQKALDAN